MRSAIVHDWLASSVGGGENVLASIHRLFPSPIFTLLANRELLKNSYFKDLEIHTSFIQKIPFALTKYRNMLPLFPWAIGRFDLSLYDVVISSSHCVAKGVSTHPNQLHICYCHTPMRYAWDLMDSYLREAKLDRGMKKVLAKWLLSFLRSWDVKSSKNVDHYIANSGYIAKRIERCYGRKSTVIYPPVDTEFFQMKEKKENYFVAASRLVPNKRIDLIVSAFSKMPDKKLLVIGDGPEKEKIQSLAANNIEFLEGQTREELRGYLQNAKAFIFAAVEDFGILPVEAMASGTPVIALGQGGVLESVLENKTGLFFKEQKEESLFEALKIFERVEIDPKNCRKRAELFSQKRFDLQFSSFVKEKYDRCKA